MNEKRIYQIHDTLGYDERQSQLENNIYVLTSLVEEYMYTYLYYESVELSAVRQQSSARILTEIGAITVVAAFVIFGTLGYSIRLSRSMWWASPRRGRNRTGGWPIRSR